MLSKNQIKEIQSLQLKKFRDMHRLFIAEGVKTVSEIIEHHPDLIKQVFATREFIESNREKIQAAQISVSEITENDLKKISLQQAPNHVLAVCHYFTESFPDLDLTKDFSLYLDDVRDPGNFGTIVRLAGWFGISGIFCSPGSCDFYNPKVIQSTMGAFMRVKIAYLPLPELLQKLEVKAVYGAVLNGKNIYRQALAPGLIVIGNEANGISDENLKSVTHPLTIPAGAGNDTESLNAAMATSIIVSEFFRQLQPA